jgi:hypothetical protein
MYRYAWCSPSRNSFLTGRYPDTLEIWNFGKSFRDTRENPPTGGGSPDMTVVPMPQYFKQVQSCTSAGPHHCVTLLLATALSFCLFLFLSSARAVDAAGHSLLCSSCLLATACHCPTCCSPLFTTTGDVDAAGHWRYCSRCFAPAACSPLLATDRHCPTCCSPHFTTTGDVDAPDHSSSMRAHVPRRALIATAAAGCLEAFVHF